MRVLAAAALLMTLALAGCASDGGTDDTDGATASSGSGSATSTRSSTGASSGSGSSSQTGTAGPGAGTNHAPAANLSANRTSGPAPLAVTFSLNGSDQDGDALAWTLAFGDNSTNATGSSLPANATHTFAAAGNYTVLLLVTDGNASANVTVLVQVTGAGKPAGPAGKPLTWSGAGVATPLGCLTVGTDGEGYYYFDKAIAGSWTFKATSNVPGVDLITEWWDDDAHVADLGATGVIPAGVDNVAVCGDPGANFTLTLSAA